MIFKIIDAISVKWIEYRANYTRAPIVSLYRLADKRKFRRKLYSYPNLNLWRCVDECIFCKATHTLFEHEWYTFAEDYLAKNPIQYNSLLDMKGLWR